MPCHPRNPRLRTSPAEIATPVLSPQAESAGRPWQLRIPWTSHHLKVLHEAGIITSERRGTWVYYRLEPAVLDRMGALLTSPVS